VDFCFAKHSKRNRNSPFWRAYKEVRKAFDTTSGGIETNVLWTNLYKVSNNGKSWYGKNSKDGKQDRESVEKALGAVLLQEVNILKPTGIIFFTGPRYDRYLKESFKGDVTFSEVNSEYTKRQLAKIEVDVHRIPIFRTYHPNYLQRSRDNYSSMIGIVIESLRQGICIS